MAVWVEGVSKEVVGAKDAECSWQIAKPLAEYPEPGSRSMVFGLFLLYMFLEVSPGQIGAKTLPTVFLAIYSNTTCKCL
jgi:hypothetical protein